MTRVRQIKLAPAEAADERSGLPAFAGQIDWLSVDTLKPYARNARTHSRKQVRQIADSIERFATSTEPPAVGLHAGAEGAEAISAIVTDRGEEA